MKNNTAILKEAFSGKDIFFINPDVKRGLGLENILPQYHIVCLYQDPLIPVLRKQGANIFCLEEETDSGTADILNNTGRLMDNEKVSDYIRRHSANRPYIMYFKPSYKIDTLSEKLGYLPVGNDCTINEKYENKISGFEFINRYFKNCLIYGITGVLGKFVYGKLANDLGLPFVIQFGHGWAGKTTFIIRDEKEFKALKNNFISTKVKICKYISGYTVLNNCTVYRKKVIISPPAVQISGIQSLNPNPSVTCGRQWSKNIIPEDKISEIYLISEKVGKLMEKSGFKGFFGLDFLIDGYSGKLYLSEINARLTASSAFYAKLETGVGMIPQTAYHIASFLSVNLPENIQDSRIIRGAQLILRRKNNLNKFKGKPKTGVYQFRDNKIKFLFEKYFPEKLKSNEFIFTYRNKIKSKEDENELARLETKGEIIESPYKLTEEYNSLFSD